MYSQIPLYMNGASTNPWFLRQLPMLVHRLECPGCYHCIVGWWNYVFWGAWGYMSLPNIIWSGNELDHLAQFLTIQPGIMHANRGFKEPFCLLNLNPVDPQTSVRLRRCYGNRFYVITDWIKTLNWILRDKPLPVLAGHTFQHELQVAVDAGACWEYWCQPWRLSERLDTDQFPLTWMNYWKHADHPEAGGFGGGITLMLKPEGTPTDLDDVFRRISEVWMLCPRAGNCW